MKIQEQIEVGEIRRLVAAAMEFAFDRRSLLLFSGRVGCGKTHAAKVALELHPEAGAVATAFELSRLPPWDKSIDELIRTRGVLVIDDVGTELEVKAGKFAALIDGIVNGRHSKGLKTILTTNLPIAVFRDRFGERVLDRIRGDGRAIESNAESLRGRELGSVSVWRYPLKPDRSTWDEICAAGHVDRDRDKVIELSSAFVRRLGHSKRYVPAKFDVEARRAELRRQVDDLREKQG